jgi:bifunctional DNA-binding transcriptional regulator/antitoxin component of YhaV-PrlF toxin-antitoxin module
VLSINRHGHLQLPVAVRRWCDLAPGDKVLLAAEPDQQLLIVHPPATLDAMITQAYAAVPADKYVRAGQRTFRHTNAMLVCRVPVYCLPSSSAVTQ